MATSIVNNGLTGLLAAQAGILTTSHNISNASTPGYSRQQIVQTTNQSMQTGSGFFGQGTNVQTVQRVYSQYLTGSVMAAQTQVGQMDAYLSQIQQIDNMLADPSAGLSPALSGFFKGVQDVAANPSSIPARQSLLSSAQALVARFQSLNQSLDEQRQGVNEQITSEVTLINSYTAQIAAVNQQIILANSGQSNQQPNDLLDQRDQLLQALNKDVRVTTAMQTNGTISVFIGNGQPVVMGTQSYSLVAQASTSDPQQTVVGLKAMNGNVIELQQSLLTGGTLGGLMAFRSESLDSAQNELGRIALNLAQTFNRQHELGQDLNGTLGLDLFSFPANASNNMAAYMNLYANKTNTGNGVLTAQIVQSDYRLVAVNNGGTMEYSISRLNDNGTTMPASAGPITIGPPAFTGGTISIDGVTITAPAAAGLTAGDAYTIKPGDPSATRVVADATNSAAASATSVTATQAGNGALTGTDYRIDYTSAGYVVTRLSDNRVLTPTINTDPANTITFEGITVKMAGTPRVGDTFILQPTRNAARDIGVNISDPTLIAAGAPFRTSKDSANTGSAAIDGGSMVALDPASMPFPAAVTMPYNLTTADGGGTLNVTVNGVSKDITIPAAAGYTAATLATAMNTAIVTAFGSNVATASVVGGNIVLTAPSNGTNSTGVSVASGLTGAPLNAATVFGTMTNSTRIVTLTFNGPTAVPPNTWTVSTSSGTPPQWNTTIPASAFTPGRQNVIDLNGIRFTLSGTPQDGDKIYIGPNSSGVSDNRNGQALGALQTTRLMIGNSATFEEGYSQIVSQIGNKTREVKVTGLAQQSLANEANDAVQQLSGVNLDEEAANLIRYQQAYQASAKMIDVGSKLFDTFLSAIG